MILSATADILIEASVIRGNTSNAVGGVFLHEGGTALVRDCLVAGNGTLWFNSGTGGIGAIRSHLRVEGCTVASNRGQASSGGLTVGDGATLELDRSIVWDNCVHPEGDGQGSETGKFVPVELGTLVVTCSIIDTSRIAGEGTIEMDGQLGAVDPLFCDPGDCDAAPFLGGDYSVDASSPAVPPQSPCGRIGAFSAGCGVVGVPAIDDVDRRAWLVASPNPTDGAVEFRVVGRRAGNGDIAVYDANGRQVWRASPQGYRVHWDGRDEQGRRVPPGVYFGRIEGDANTSVKVVLR